MSALATYLQAHSLDDLARDLSIRVKLHPTLPLAILNYDQIDSPKSHPVVRECRQKVIETFAPYRVVSKSFDRFFNIGECKEDTEFLSRCLSDATFTEKHDGSLISVFFYRDEWHLITRGSWADGPMDPSRPDSPTFKDMAWSILQRDGLVPPHFTYVFELCTPYNQIVRRYDVPCMYLLALVRPSTGEELPQSFLDEAARALGVYLPKRWDSIHSVDEAREIVSAAEKDVHGFEGLVARVYHPLEDRYVRVKLKSEEYVRVHHNLREVLTRKDVIRAVVRNELDEISASHRFTAWIDEAKQMTEAWARIRAAVQLEWNIIRPIESVKELARHIVALKSPIQSLYVEFCLC